MAESILFDIATEVLKKIGSLVGRQVSSLWNLESDLESLAGTLSTIQAVLLDAEKKQAHDHQLRDWLGKLKDVLLDAEDVLEEFEFQAPGREVVRQKRSTSRKVRQFFSSSNPVVLRSQIIHKIKQIRERLDRIAGDRRNFTLIESTPVEVSYVIPKERETNSFLGASCVIGRENDKEKIISFLMQQTDNNVSVIPIVGIGGLGKTTLTKMVYNDKRVDKFFPLKMWACVSDDFDVIRLMKEIIRSATDHAQDCGKLKGDEIPKRLQEILTGKNFMLVLDDVWNEKPMKWLELKDLLMNGVSGSKIIVSTRSKRVAEIMNTIPSHFLQGFSSEESLSLFKKYAFKDGEGKDFPRLIKFGKDIVAKCKGVPLAVDRDNEDILPVLKLSYDHLPSPLKRCFTYLCLFSKDYNYKNDYVAQYWMALGLLKTSYETEELEDVASQYIKDLWSRGFLEDFWDRNFCWQFRVHDLALSMTKVDNSRSVRSVILPTAKKYGDAPILGSFISEDISKFKYLRLLFLYGIFFEELPNSIGTLRHLRYLDLAHNSSLKKISESICELQKLQMLRLRSCYQLKKLPNNIRKIISLRYLEITTQEEVLPENEIGCLGSLQYLYLYHCYNLVSLCEGMQGLKSLRALHLENTSVSSLPNTIKYLTKLEMLVISFSRKLNLKMELQAEDLDLRLSLKKFIVYGLDSLVDLPQLLFQASAGTLKYIEIGTCKNLEALPEWFENLTSLEKLQIKDCPRLSSLPEGIKRLTSLKELVIRDCPDLIESCRNDESKIAHIQLNLSEPLTETAGADEVIGDLRRKLELFQTKVGQAVSVLKPQLSSESQSSAVAAIQELEALAKMDISTPLKEDTQVAQSQPPEQQPPPQPPPL
ncbi:putative disease resistance protein RGA3 [Pistacia vera]|uniref:putative disease resistance protein RGA3 n=1 Tax=Pistacia vera TaxID=55513 RepID=UPI001263BD08|nr:putative disease resistance protein RGA3 [Pistacia vera]